MKSATLKTEQDPLTRYLADVECRLGDRLVLIEEEDYERFFEHVIKYFERGLAVDECAGAW
jgi:hypothetical protein